MKRFVFLMVPFLLIVFNLDTQAKIYKWIDDQGVEHYSSTPPPKEKRRVDENRQLEQEIENKMKAHYTLELISWSWYNGGHHFAIVKGLVKNNSKSPIRNITALAMFYDSNGRFINSDSSLIEYQTLMPGQSSPFKIMSRWNPAMQKCSVSFKHFRGGEISTFRNKK